jgi:hypothetical protein
MNVNYFDLVNKSMFGEFCTIGTNKYIFMCFYMGEAGVPFVMLKEVETNYIYMCLMSNSLKLAF